MFFYFHYIFVYFFILFQHIDVLWCKLIKRWYFCCLRNYGFTLCYFMDLLHQIVHICHCLTNWTLRITFYIIFFSCKVCHPSSIIPIVFWLAICFLNWSIHKAKQLRKYVKKKTRYILHLFALNILITNYPKKHSLDKCISKNLINIKTIMIMKEIKAYFYDCNDSYHKLSHLCKS